MEGEMEGEMRGGRANERNIIDELTEGLRHKNTKINAQR